jgi:hypothetical protein
MGKTTHATRLWLWVGYSDRSLLRVPSATAPDGLDERLCSKQCGNLKYSHLGVHNYKRMEAADKIDCKSVHEKVFGGKLI